MVNHLTRIQRGYICVAGIDSESGNHIRPVLEGRLTTKLLARNGGPFDMACLVDLGSTTHVGSPPEVEDHKFNLRKAVQLDVLSRERFWALLNRSARRRLSDIFGPELIPLGPDSCGVPMSKGRLSLGCLVPGHRPVLYLRPRPGKPDQVRMGLNDGTRHLDLSVSDIRLYADDHVTPNAPLVARGARRLKEGGDIILSVGLTRPFASSADLPAMHWLQVNNIHFESNPTWQLG